MTTTNPHSRKAQIAFLVAVLAEGYRQKITEATVEAYCMGLDGLAMDCIERAVKAATQTCKFMPVPAELRELAGEFKPEDRAVHAFSELERAIAKVGYYQSPNFDDPLINATVRVHGGWERICTLPTEEFDKWFRKDFERTYAALCRTGVNGEMTAPLVGFFERTNSVLGYDRPQDRVDVRTGLPWAGEPAKRLQSLPGAPVPRLNLQRA